MKKLFLLLVFSTFLFAKHLNVLYIWHTTPDQPFTKITNKFAHAVAKDLNITLTSVYPNKYDASNYGNLNRFSYENFAKKYFFAKEKPDVIISVLFRKTGKQILEFSKKSGVPVFIVNTNIPKEDRAVIQKPREVYKKFLGLVASNEAQAGELLFNRLYEQMPQKQGKYHVIGISGPQEASEAIERNSGLKNAVAQYENVQLNQVVSAKWDEQQAYKVAKKLIHRFRSLDLIWTASDSMALGAKKAIDELNSNAVVGGIDWSARGIDAVEKNQLNASVGGHFMNGGIALILLYDYFHGKDFKEEFGVEFNPDMFALTSHNIAQYKENFNEASWDRINFKNYSKVFNPTLKKYDFSLQRFMEDIIKKKNNE